MFGFFKSDARGSDKKAATPKSIPDHARGSAPISSPTVIAAGKRRRDALDDSDAPREAVASAKRSRLDPGCSRHDQRGPCDAATPLPPSSSTALEQARDIIEHQFGLEVLLKHNELRLINQELAKCQIALEQLRRCHLIPYPQDCPTPAQMLDISSGKSSALAIQPGEPVPRWAPPFGVVDGPYARHYAKWLIPDAMFDGMQPEWHFTAEGARARGCVAEGRTTRNSVAETAASGKGRPVRGLAGQKLQALSSGYPQAKDKSGPCVLKRSDGQTVKLVCIDCNRENFSSTQGFINHCRIAHKRDFKSHEEAAMQSGQPVDVAEVSPSTAEEKAPAAPSGTAFVHPYARQDMADQQAYRALRSRIEESLKLYHAGKLPGVDCIPSARSTESPGAQGATPNKFVVAPETPYLSRLMESRAFGGSLRDLVTDAKTEVPLDEVLSDQDSDDSETPPYGFAGVGGGAAAARTRVVMRVPAGSGKIAASSTASGRPTSSKGRHPDMHLVSPTKSAVMSKDGCSAALSDEDVDIDDANLSPNTLVSNNAPSLVSDDGEYDDSDEGSSVSGASDDLEDTSMSDVAEITLDDEHEARTLRRGSNGAAGPVRLRKDDVKHVTFITPVKNNAKQRRVRRA